MTFFDSRAPRRSTAGLALLTTALCALGAQGQHDSIHHMDDVVISAGPLAVNRMDAVVPISVIDENALRTRLEPSLGETLSREPGVSSSYFGPGASRPIVRGLDRDRVRVLENGLGLGDVSATSEDHAVGQDVLSARRIEVVRGPATLRYGSTAIGGVVNIIDGRIPETPLDQPAGGLLDLRYGSGDELKSSGAVLEGGNGLWSYHLDGFYRETDDIEIPGYAESDPGFEAHHEADADHDHDHDEAHAEEEARVRGHVPNSDTESHGGAVGLSRATESGFIGLSVGGWKSEYGVPGHEHAQDEDEHAHDEGHAEDEHAHGEGDEGVRIEADSIRVQLRGEILEPAAALRSITYGLAYSTYTHDEIEDGGEVGTTFENDAWEARTELIHNPIGALEGAVGAQVQWNDFSAVGEEAFVPPSETFNVGLFAFEELPLAPDFLKLQMAARYEYQDIDADGHAGQSFHAVSGSAGLVLTPDDTYVAALNAAYTERAPQASELYADGPHVATRIAERGDAGLDNESAVGLDLSLRRKAGFVTGGVSLFHTWFDNFIALAPNGESDDGYPVFAYRGDEARFYGGEVEVILHLIDSDRHHLHLDLLADHVRGRNEDAKDDLPRIPPWRYLAGLGYESERFGVRVEGVFVDRQNKVAAFETPTDGYEFLNVSGFLCLPVEGAEVDLFVTGTNLTDEEARVHTSFLKDQVPLRGRSVLVGLRAAI